MSTIASLFFCFEMVARLGGGGGVLDLLQSPWPAWPKILFSRDKMLWRFISKSYALLLANIHVRISSFKFFH